VPAPGASEIAEQVADVCRPSRVRQDITAGGIDHGIWSLLLHGMAKHGALQVGRDLASTLWSGDRTGRVRAAAALRTNHPTVRKRPVLVIPRLNTEP